MSCVCISTARGGANVDYRPTVIVGKDREAKSISMTSCSRILPGQTLREKQNNDKCKRLLFHSRIGLRRKYTEASGKHHHLIEKCLREYEHYESLYASDTAIGSLGLCGKESGCRRKYPFRVLDDR